MKSMKTMMITAALLFTSMLNMTAQNSKNNQVWNAEMTDGNVTAVFTEEKEIYMPSNKLKSVATYDLQGRLIKREVQKWNRRKQQWVNLRCWTYDYSDGKMTVEFASWNKRKHCYNPTSSRIEYDFITSDVFSVKSYKWDGKQHTLQLANSNLLMKDIDSLSQLRTK